MKYIHQTVSSSHDGDRSDAMVCNKIIANLYILYISEILMLLILSPTYDHSVLLLDGYFPC